MTDLEKARAEVLADLGYKPLSKTWARVEIVLGLLACAAGVYRMTHVPAAEPLPAGGILLFILGGYLTLAGHRSHLYQTLNDHTAYLLCKTRRNHEED